MNCLDNLDKCKASCCKSISFKAPSHNPNPDYFIMKTMTKDYIYYLKLHNINIKRLPNRSYMVIPPNPVIIQQLSDNTALFESISKCSALTSDFKCKLHGTQLKPILCQRLNEQTSQSGSYNITSGCIYRKL